VDTPAEVVRVRLVVLVTVEAMVYGVPPSMIVVPGPHAEKKVPESHVTAVPLTETFPEPLLALKLKTAPIFRSAMKFELVEVEAMSWITKSTPATPLAVLIAGAALAR
jgi:hypothetical protein